MVPPGNIGPPGDIVPPRNIVPHQVDLTIQFCIALTCLSSIVAWQEGPDNEDQLTEGTEMQTGPAEDLPAPASVARAAARPTGAVVATPSADQVLVLGARGRLGQALVIAFSRAGWTVLAQVRPGASLALPPGPAAQSIRRIESDLRDPEALAAAAAGTAVVVNALSPGDYGRRAWAREVPVQIAFALAVTRRLGATLMQPGNVYPYGRSLPARLDEQTPFAADTHHGRLRQRLEEDLQRVACDGDPRSIVIRAGDFYGTGTGSWLDLVMLRNWQRRQLVLPGDRAIVHAWAYLPDLAATFVRVAQVRDRLPAFARLHFGGHAVTGNDWVQALDPDGGLRVSPLNWAGVALAGLVSAKLRAVLEMRYLWQRPHELVNDRLVELIGAEPHTPFAIAAHAAVAALDPDPQSRSATVAAVR